MVGTGGLAEEQGDPCGELLPDLPPPAAGRRAAGTGRALQFPLAQGVRPCWPTLTNCIGMKLALIPAGTFLMGSPEDEEGHEEDEWPQHEVTISRPFWLAAFIPSRRRNPNR